MEARTWAATGRAYTNLWARRLPTFLTMRSRRLFRAIALIATVTGCASMGGRSEGPTLPIDVQVNNNLHVPADLTVYAVSHGGNRALLGDVPPNGTTTLKFKPVAFSEPYRMLATRAGGRDIMSQTFIVASDMTGAIIWTLVPNVVGFVETEPDTATTQLDQGRARGRVIP